MSARRGETRIGKAKLVQEAIPEEDVEPIYVLVDADNSPGALDHLAILCNTVNTWRSDGAAATGKFTKQDIEEARIAAMQRKKEANQQSPGMLKGWLPIPQRHVYADYKIKVRAFLSRTTKSIPESLMNYVGMPWFGKIVCSRTDVPDATDIALLHRALRAAKWGKSLERTSSDFVWRRFALVSADNFIYEVGRQLRSYGCDVIEINPRVSHVALSIAEHFAGFQRFREIWGVAEPEATNLLTKVFAPKKEWLLEDYARSAQNPEEGEEEPAANVRTVNYEPEEGVVIRLTESAESAISKEAAQAVFGKYPRSARRMLLQNETFARYGDSRDYARFLQTVFDFERINAGDRFYLTMADEDVIGSATKWRTRVQQAPQKGRNQDWPV